jgi:hypothetical protein
MLIIFLQELIQGYFNTVGLHMYESTSNDSV